MASQLQLDFEVVRIAIISVPTNVRYLCESTGARKCNRSIIINSLLINHMMDLDLKKFGRGPRELGGSVDLLDHYKLRKHLDFLCRGHYHPLYGRHNTLGMWWGTLK
ncbi:hypothetical protein RND71_014340 [Anisodus tanguticus]|uniref:Uncharacterized protein n=1 Tax=Anisodus tanguticus TaxID=243964 RepID=A0AAE1VNK0_9SOLA|nr:hypothetical protein RND71_014340 [Anisodus tanguticus]